MPNYSSRPRLRWCAYSSIATSLLWSTMSGLLTVSWIGNSFGNEKGVIEFNAGKTRPDGLDAVLSIRILEFKFCVETFYYGFNLKTFIEQASAVTGGGSTVAKLSNYDQSLVLEFVRLGKDREFVSIRYKSIAPDAPEEGALQGLRRLSTLAPAGSIGSAFVLNFMKLDTCLEDCSNRFADLLAQLNVATDSPYPESVS